MPHTHLTLGAIINQLSGVRAELKAIERHARDLADEAAATQSILRDVQSALVEHMMEQGGLVQTKRTGQKVVDDAHVEQHQGDT